jgi:hypothetical protein
VRVCDTCVSACEWMWCVCVCVCVEIRTVSVLGRHHYTEKEGGDPASKATHLARATGGTQCLNPSSPSGTACGLLPPGVTEQPRSNVCALCPARQSMGLVTHARETRTEFCSRLHAKD